MSPPASGSASDAAVRELVAAIERLRYDGSNSPASWTLRQGWPDIGRAWITEWANELGRDLAIAERELAAANSAAGEEDALTPLENVFWRLGSGREKFHTVIALAFAVPSLGIGKDKKQTLTFRPRVELTREKLQELGQDASAASRILELDGQVRRRLLIRHQVAHSLAPVIHSFSLTFYEVGFVERGNVTGYAAYHLPPRGWEEVDDLSGPTLRACAERLAEAALQSLVAATRRLAELLDTAGALQPPPIIWQAVEIGELFHERDQASSRSRDSANEGARAHPDDPLGA